MNFKRFYASLNRMKCVNRDDVKRSLVLQYTNNRTDSLREMTVSEYNACCAALDELTGLRDEQKEKRSVCLHLLQRLGIDTSDWGRVNAFCQDRRICGKSFYRLSNDELDGLCVKLRIILRKGGMMRKNRSADDMSVRVVYIPQVSVNS